MKTISSKYENMLKNTYYSDLILGGRDKLYQYLANKYPGDHPTREQVMQWLKNQKIHQIHQRAPPRVSTKSLLVRKPRKYWQLDLCGTFSTDKSYKYIVGIIDVNTK